MVDNEHVRDWSMEDLGDNIDVDTTAEDKTLRMILDDREADFNVADSGVFYKKYFEGNSTVVVFVDLRDHPYSIYAKNEETNKSVGPPEKQEIQKIRERVKYENRKHRARREAEKSKTLDEF